MSDLEARIAEVLADHRRVRGARDRMVRCTCGWKVSGAFLQQTLHEEHVAAMLAPVVEATGGSALV